MNSIKIDRISIIGMLFLAAVMFGFGFQEMEKPTRLELQKQLEQEFVAPCCWREAVGTHRSGKAAEVRTEISNLLDRGKTPKEVKASLVATYGERILIMPTTEGFNLLAWVGPFIMIGIGFVIVGVWLYRFRPKEKS